MQVELPQVIRTAKQLYHAFKIDTDSFDETLVASALREFAPDVRLATSRDGLCCFCINMSQLLASLSPKLRDLFPVRGEQRTEVSCGLRDTWDNERRVYFGSPYNPLGGLITDRFDWDVVGVSLAANILQHLDRLVECHTDKVPKGSRNRIRKVYCEYLEERFP